MRLEMTTSAITLERPKPGEYNPYFDRYISLIPGNDILGTLDKQFSKTIALLSGRSEQDANQRYAPEKWTLKELLGHVIDTERIMSYRALCIARNDRTPLSGFEQDAYVSGGPFAEVAFNDLLEEFKTVRAATLSLLRHLRPGDWTRRGVVDQKETSVRALAYIIAGHELHHRHILEERYFSTTPARADIA
jgi:uncharacterized damage-inducible protein DinB